MPANVFGMVVIVIPIFSFGFSWIFLSIPQMSSTKLLGAAIVLTGIFVGLRNSNSDESGLREADALNNVPGGR